jgi:hypothetical protein
MSEPTNEKLADGMALWEEHKPQCAEDWIGVAERWIAAGESTAQSSPLFQALVAVVESRDRRLAVADVWAAIDDTATEAFAGFSDDYVDGWRDACGAISKALGLNTTGGEG